MRFTVRTSNQVIDKALWFQTEGRIRILTHTDDLIRASVDGIHATYLVCVDPEGWSCTCPAGQNHKTCSHAEAVALEIQAT